MDQITTRQQRLTYAKICVEVDALKEIPRVINVELREGRVIQVKVDIPWHPQRCQICKNFGHATKNCAKGPSQEEKKWVPKRIIDNNVEEKKIAEGSLSAGKGKAPLLSVESSREVVLTEPNPVKMVEGSSNKPNGKAGSVFRYSILVADEAGAESKDPKKDKSAIEGHKPLLNITEVSSVASLMEIIKVQVQNQAKERHAKEASTSVLLAEEKGTSSLVEDDGSIASEDESDYETGRPKLAMAGIARKPRLVAAKMALVVEAIKSRNKKSRRQLKKSAGTRK
ncbi:hypothetical protein PTKIN_Ptkin02bG0115500 [Pterospermum kingtungense]